MYYMYLFMMFVRYLAHDGYAICRKDREKQTISFWREKTPGDPFNYDLVRLHMKNRTVEWEIVREGTVEDEACWMEIFIEEAYEQCVLTTQYLIDDMVDELGDYEYVKVTHRVWEGKTYHLVSRMHTHDQTLVVLDASGNFLMRQCESATVGTMFEWFKDEVLGERIPF